jgi:hypothetical protein
LERRPAPSREMRRADSRCIRPPWAVYKSYPDSGDGDIELVSTDGATTRLTEARGDDRPMSFSPDGRQLLFLSTRWSRMGWSAIAVVDLETREVKRLAESDSDHGPPSWNPDGTRIVYDRELNSRLDREVCVCDADGSHTVCGPIPGWTHVGILGWLDHHRVLFTGASAAMSSAIAIYDVDAHTVTTTDYPPRSAVTLDNTGKWALTRLPNSASAQVRLSPATQFERSIIIGTDSGVPSEIRFISPGTSNDYLESIAIIRPQHVFAGVPSRLNTKGWTRKRAPISVHPQRWRSFSPELATVDSLGILIAQRPGNAVIELSAGGWRRVIDTIKVETASARLIIRESWDESSFTRWKPFGDPKPSIIPDGGRKALANNGDGNFFSGVYLKPPIDPKAGVSFDAELSTPITKYQWQLIHVGLQPFSNANRIERWDHRTGYIQQYVDSGDGCAFQYPSGEGPASITGSPWYESWVNAVRDSSHVLHGGSWYRVRVQLFPDGRCGLAINGHPVVITTSGVILTSPILAHIQGNSVDGRILVGKVLIQTGVPTDIDWSKLTFDGYQWAVAH